MDKTKRQSILFLITLTLFSNGQNNFQLGGIEPFKSGNEYAVGTFVFSALDATFTTSNIVRLIKTDKHTSNATFGLVFGKAQTVYGLFNTNATEKNASALTAVNIGLGFTTFATSIVRLSKKSLSKESNLTFNLFCLPPVDNNSGTLCFSILRRLK